MLHKSCLSGRLGAVGFTLIELLVVVLIIGILAAVALPQYQKAVMKSHLAAMKFLVRSLAQAEERYYLVNNDYTIDIAQLDVGFPEQPTRVQDYQTGNRIYYFSWGWCNLIDFRLGGLPRLACQNGGKYTGDYPDEGDIGYLYHMLHSSSPYAGKFGCTAFHDLATKICQQETNKQNVDSGHTRFY